MPFQTRGNESEGMSTKNPQGRNNNSKQERLKTGTGSSSADDAGMAVTQNQAPPDSLHRGSRPKRILVAEDHQVNQKLIRAMLDSIGYQVDIAENGRVAVDKLREGSYSLVLMDCQMPELDGYAATSEIRSIAAENLRNIPIIAMTANAEMGDRERCLHVGMNDFISKPMRIKQLQALLEKWLP